LAYNIRQIAAERKFCDELSLEALSKVVPAEEIHSVLNLFQANHRRHRKLTMTAIVWLLIALHLYPHLAIGRILQKLARGLRFIWHDPDWRLPKDNAITYRRYQLGARPLVALFHRIARPIATPETPGAFAFGLRLMAIDSAVDDLPDTADNAVAFGRLGGPKGASAFPQLRSVYLVECGTHAIVDAGVWPVRVSERVGGFRLLRSVSPGMLLMWDRGFHDFDMLVASKQRQAEVLSRLPDSVKPEVVRQLKDGSQLAYLYASAAKRRQAGERLLVRVITYMIKDPAREGGNKRHRVVTTLLEEEKYPALEMVCLYHERWEIELVIDELQTHQRLSGAVLRSLKPVGVIQEFYALLIAHFAVRYLMAEAALREGIDPDRLSFVQALSVIEDTIAEFQMVDRQQREQLYERMLKDLAAGRLPERRQRSNPRRVKRKMTKFHIKRAQHYNWPQPSGPFRDAVALI